MAIQHDYNFKGIPIPNAYHRISWGSCYKGEDGLFRLKFDIEISSAAGQPVIESRVGAYECVYDIVSMTNAITQAYNYLMTLPEFAGAVQV